VLSFIDHTPVGLAHHPKRQGSVGSGKPVGAVTHVLINDPTTGYGIFIENMLANMSSSVQPKAA
jgi:hypothetical protein